MQVPAGVTAATVEQFNKAATLLGAGKPAESVKIFDTLMKDFSGNVDALLMYGTALLQTGRTADAETQLRKAEAISPVNEAVLMNLGSVYQRMGRYPEALSHFKRYLEKYPHGQQAGLLRGMMDALQTEANRMKGVESSAGKENYLSEALALGPARWRQDQMPLKIVISDGSASKGFKPAYTETLKEAFKAWADASEGKISLEFLDKADNPAILCTWVDDPKEVVNPAEGGQALVAPDEDGNMSPVKLKLLTQNPNFKRDIDEAAMKNLCMHEVGHALGILGHSSSPDDVMFTTLNASSPLLALSERDKKTIVALYTAAPEFLAQHKRKDLSNTGMLGADDNPQNRAIKLNSEALNEYKAGNYKKSVSMLEEALKLSPDTEFIYVNLGNGYGHLGQDAYKAGNHAEAIGQLEKAVDCYIKGKRPDVAKISLGNLAMIARAKGNETEAKKYEARASALK